MDSHIRVHMLILPELGQCDSVSLLRSACPDKINFLEKHFHLRTWSTVPCWVTFSHTQHDQVSIWICQVKIWMCNKSVFYKTKFWEQTFVWCLYNGKYRKLGHIGLVVEKECIRIQTRTEGRKAWFIMAQFIGYIV